MSRSPLSDRKEGAGLGPAVSRVLAVGLLISMALLVAGVVLALTRPGISVPRVTSFSDLPRAVSSFEPGGFFELGLLVLVATPIARVVVLGAGFARGRAWMFCGLAVFVLALLALSLVLGLKG